MTDTKKLRELLAKGTKPPLEVKTNRAGNPTIGPVGSEGMIAPWIVSEEDAALIVSAVNALPALLDEVEGLRAALSRLLLEFDFLIEEGTLPDIRDDMIFVAARTALGETK